MKILLAYDGSTPAQAALDEVLSRPWPPGSEIRLVTVIELPVGAESGSGEVFYAPLLERVRASMREEAFHRDQLALERFRGREDLATSYEIREGTAKSALLEAIQEWGADLVVIGSNGGHGIARLFLGSVSHALVTHATCSVEVVRPKLSEGDAVPGDARSR